MIQGGLLAALMVAVSPVHIESDDCPSKPEIERRLDAMFSGWPPAAPDVARISRAAEEVHVNLTTADGAVIAERSLIYAGSCAELADLVAVVVASWESDVHPEFTRPEADLAPAAALAIEPSLSGAARPSWALDLAVGAGVSLADSATLASGAALTWFPRSAGLGLRLSGLGEGTHTVDIGERRARWQRWSAGAELDWREAGDRSSFDLHGGVALAILRARGVGFDQNQADSSLAAGLLLGARFSLWLNRRWAVYSDLTGSYCERTQTLRGSLALGREVPHWEGHFTLGLAARLWPALSK